MSAGQMTKLFRDKFYIFHPTGATCHTDGGILLLSVQWCGVCRPAMQNEEFYKISERRILFDEFSAFVGDFMFD